MKFYNYKSDYYNYITELHVAQKELFDYYDNLIKNNSECSTNDVKSAKLYEPEDGRDRFLYDKQIN